MNTITLTDNNGNRITVDRNKFLGQIKVGVNGKVQVVTILSNGDEGISWFSWQAIKQAVEDVMNERKVGEQ